MAFFEIMMCLLSGWCLDLVPGGPTIQTRRPNLARDTRTQYPVARVLMS